jgi:uncharacterized protein (AIM24 family)
MQAHEIDYQIFGEEMQYVEIELDPQEIVIAEAGSFMMMDNNIQMDFWRRIKNNLVCLANSKRAGRVLTGESLFMTAFINQHHKAKYLLLLLILENSSDRFN